MTIPPMNGSSLKCYVVELRFLLHYGEVRYSRRSDGIRGLEDLLVWESKGLLPTRHFKLTAMQVEQRSGHATDSRLRRLRLY
jgi:hypothetical protein